MDKERLRDYSVRPGDDFYKYATGHFADEYKQPADYPSWTFFDVLDEDIIIRQLRDIIDNLDCNNPLQRKMADMLAVYRSPKNQDPETLKLMRPYIEHLRSIEDKDELLRYAITDLNAGFPISVDIGPDMKNSSHYEIYLSQSPILYNKKYYIGPDFDVYNKYLEVVNNVLMMMGYSEEDSANLINTYFDFEKKLIDSAYSVEDLDKPELNYRMMSLEEMTSEFDYDIKRWLSYFDCNETYRCIVSQVDYVRNFFKLLNESSLDTLKDVLEFTFVLCNVDSFSDEISDEFWKFSQYKSGAKERTPKWKREIDYMCGIFSDPIGKIYSDKYFGQEAKNRAIDMISLLKESFAEIIASQEWMTERTKRFALDKLDAIAYKKIGFPDKWDLDFDDLKLDAGLSLFENSFAIYDFCHKKYMKKYYNKDVDVDEWPMHPYTINACFSPMYPVEICFPAGILQSPFFDFNASDSENLGSIGVVIGHEMTHGFDRNGRMFDKFGNMENWWTVEDEQHFTSSLVEPMIKHFSKKEVLPFVKCNGELEVSENIADNGGLRIALNALCNIMDSRCIVGEERKKWLREFWLSYATTWCCVQTEEITRNNNLNDEHAAPFMRVNAQVQLFDEWYEAFDIQPGDALYLEPEKRIRTW